MKYSHQILLDTNEDKVDFGCRRSIYPCHTAHLLVRLFRMEI